MTMIIITMLMMTITMMTRRECQTLVGALAAGGLPLPWVNSLGNALQCTDSQCSAMAVCIFANVVYACMQDVRVTCI